MNAETLYERLYAPSRINLKEGRYVIFTEDVDGIYWREYDSKDGLTGKCGLGAFCHRLRFKGEVVDFLTNN